MISIVSHGSVSMSTKYTAKPRGNVFQPLMLSLFNILWTSGPDAKPVHALAAMLQAIDNVPWESFTAGMQVPDRLRCQLIAQKQTFEIITESTAKHCIDGLTQYRSIGDQSTKSTSGDGRSTAS
jgi:hypothetical protein